MQLFFADMLLLFDLWPVL